MDWRLLRLRQHHQRRIHKKIYQTNFRKTKC